MQHAATRAVSTALAVCLVAVLGVSCSRSELEVDLTKRQELADPKVDHEQAQLRVAIGAMVTPKAGYAYYKRMLDWIGEELGRPVGLVDRHTYAEINHLLQSGEIDAAFVCGLPYVEGRDAFGLELLVAPQMYGATEYYSYIIVPTASPAHSLRDLEGKSFAFTDPMSNSGRLVPTHMLYEMGHTPSTFFAETTFTYAHDKSIRAVAQGLVDGAAVDHLIWKYLASTDPDIRGKTKVVEQSGGFGIPPMVVRPDLDEDTKRRLREVVLGAHQDDDGRALLGNMKIEKFVVVSDDAYDSIREIRDELTSKGMLRRAE